MNLMYGFPVLMDYLLAFCDASGIRNLIIADPSLARCFWGSLLENGIAALRIQADYFGYPVATIQPMLCKKLQMTLSCSVLEFRPTGPFEVQCHLSYAGEVSVTLTLSGWLLVRYISALKAACQSSY